MLKSFIHLRQFKKEINFFKTVTIVKKTKIMFFNNIVIRRRTSRIESSFEDINSIHIELNYQRVELKLKSIESNFFRIELEKNSIFNLKTEI